MSQATDYVIANATGSGVRTDVNSVLSAIVTKNSGTAEPSATYSYMWWADTTLNKLKIRNGANTSWLVIGDLDAASFNLTDAFANVTSAVTLTDTQLNNAVYLVSGTKMVFYEATPPTGWTQITTHNDKALRVVSGTGGGYGGSTSFTSAFTHSHSDTFVVSNHTLTTEQMPYHQHFTYGDNSDAWHAGIMPGEPGVIMGSAGSDLNDENNFYGTSGTGGGEAHNHGTSGGVSSKTISPHYVDIIICSKA
jgi:hypothetical protein